MEDVRSALTTYVTEGEPPIGLSGDAVLTAARRSRRQHLLTGAVAVCVVVLALGLAVVVLPNRGPVAGPACPSGATREALVERLSCVVGQAVRALLPPDARVSRLGDEGPSDPFAVVADPVGEAPREANFRTDVRVTDARGTGSVTVVLYPTPNSATPLCVPGDLISCSVEQLPEGTLQLTTDRSTGALTYRAALSAPWGYAAVSSNDTGEPERKDLQTPSQRPEPTLTLDQVRQLALTPGLAF
ncbi:hypothetical protein [Amycolatopsis sp. lyj-109]|uniref:hypothetical protein n=1 Tax=Amycolatopsis sp. lyj-109 TaxID=2789287 RepID=UPI003979F7D5